MMSGGLDAWTWGALLMASFAAAIASIPHCALMCGPIAMLACGTERDALATGSTRGRTALYLTARLASYAGVGAIAGGIARVVFQNLLPDWLLAASIALACVYSAVRLLRRTRTQADVVSIGPVPARVTPSRTTGFATPVILGLANGLLPCGALWVGAGIAAGGGSAARGAVAMIVFGAVTSIGPMVFRRSASLAIVHGALGRRVVAIGLIAIASVVGYRTVSGALAKSDETAVRVTACGCPRD